MSLFPMDMERFKPWAVRQLYLLMYPHMKQDFMGLKDCQAVHQEPNMTVVVAGVPANVNHVIRGGSYLCHDSYCDRYRVSARSSNAVDSSTGNMGFRVAAGPEH